ncbi:uncharacterized protein BP5553_01085 [Venustampulla echinocandica]|uniref:J domain-containing protein n=1 Tax=Venustampulla echinocandica TaxID=2656787 RepID=A0A370U002_9HELO|nr:uncharacterized protein BP5553_01085 [Venustampulla echinocandica]RDL41106.1 hypothetical protein BP5553_01085 [Venustampulla echinocandica]
MSTPPPDHYLTLGVPKDAKLPEIRSAHRKLVLKCHPDKVQDAALKAAKQDEFQKVQAAYEILSDDTRRVQYNEQVKLFELRKEMGRGNPTARSNPFEYEVRTAEPRANSYARPKPSQPSPKVYSHTPPRSYEDVVYEEPRVTPRKTTTYESADRKRSSAKDDERRRNEEDERERERVRQRAEKESRRAAHGEKKKSRDKERRRGTEEKHSRTAGVYVDDDDSDEYRYASRSSEKKSSRHRLDEEFRLQREREEAARDAARAHERASIKPAPLDPKWDKHMDFAGQYMQAARRKVAPVEEDAFRPSLLRRAETFAATSASYTVRNVTQFSDDDSPRRSSAHKESRKSAEPPPSRTRDKSGRDRRSPPAPSRDAYIVEPPSPPPTSRKPTLQTHTSAPPILPYLGREKPARSQTQDYPRTETIPPLSRAQTFQSGDRSRERASGSRLKKPVEYSSEGSDSDDQPKRRSYSPPPRRPAEPTRYIIDNGRTIPVSRHRSELHNIDDERIYSRDRSESPHGTHRSRERPSTLRTHTTSERSRGIPIRSATYYTPDPPEPIIHTVRPPKGSPRDSSHRASSRGGGPYFGEVKFAPSYGVEHVIYSEHPADIYRRGSDPSSQRRDHYPHPRGSGGREVYAS